MPAPRALAARCMSGRASGQATLVNSRLGAVCTSSVPPGQHPLELRQHRHRLGGVDVLDHVSEQRAVERAVRPGQRGQVSPAHVGPGTAASVSRVSSTAASA